jgi:WS/DGAT/MGAT family acyltransferase
MSRLAEALSPLDSLFLHLESPRTPMHSGFVGIVEGGSLRDSQGQLRLQDIRAEIDHRLHLVPKLRQRVRFSLLGETTPVWVDDPHFDIANHVRQSDRSKLAGEAEVLDLTGEFMQRRLDRGRPLWEIWFVDGLEGGRVVVVGKLHHALADGIGDVELATVLFDLECRPLSSDVSIDSWEPSPPPGWSQVVAHDFARQGAASLHMTAIALGAIQHPRRAGREFALYADAFRSLVRGLSVDSACSINVQVGETRRAAFIRQRVDELQRAERHFGMTLNDLVLTAVAGGLHDLLSARGEQVEDRTVAALVPVGIDHHGDHRLGNRISGMIVRLPIGSLEPVDRLDAVSGAEANSKHHHQALASKFLFDLLDRWPQPALTALSRLVQHQPFVNLVVTNVPGPGNPLYVMGARVLEVFPFVPLAGNLSVSVAVLSYDGQLTVGVLADPAACPDLTVLVDGIGRSFAELVAAADEQQSDTADLVGKRADGHQSVRARRAR